MRGPFFYVICVMDPDFQRYLQGLDNEGNSPKYGEYPTYADADKLVPWIEREWGKGRLEAPDNYTLGQPMSYYAEQGGPALGNFTPEDAIRAQEALEGLRDQGHGISVMQHKVHELLPKVEDYHTWKGQQKVSAARPPMYYRWVFSPVKGVSLGSNNDLHPALVPYHRDLAGKDGGQDLMHGYAYRIGNGWRLTDYEHKPVEDPFIVKQVVHALNAKEGTQEHTGASWHPAEYDWERLHYAVPQEKAAS